MVYLPGMQEVTGALRKGAPEIPWGGSRAGCLGGERGGAYSQRRDFRGSTAAARTVGT
jgi:hypothetical protein